ncbi:MAG: hypothetical protein KDA85_13735, partial [Planctomycetaceae bacterium]|nr:hypothetical protein [Planctomycetaceae bacterium]
VALESRLRLTVQSAETLTWFAGTNEGEFNQGREGVRPLNSESEAQQFGPAGIATQENMLFSPGGW